jgi:rare lipoprotein A
MTIGVDAGMMGQEAEGRIRRFARVGGAMLACLALAHCASSTTSSKYSPRLVADGEPVPKGGGSYKVGQPYRLNGKTYFPSENSAYRAEGVASWYGPDFHGRLTANGEIYDMRSISAAHPTMPLPSYARVTSLDNGRSIIVRVNDRGPYARGRLIDLSIGAAKALDFYGHGLAHVRVEYVGRAPMEGSDDSMLMATLRYGTPAPSPSRVMVASLNPITQIMGRRHDGDEPAVAAASAAQASAATPVPQERPYTLGSTGAAAPPRTETPSRRRATAAPERPSAEQYLARAQQRPPSATASAAAPPASAAVAPPPGDGTLGLMSGRGLY